jgi:hypothetical protein
LLLLLELGVGRFQQPGSTSSSEKRRFGGKSFGPWIKPLPEDKDIFLVPLHFVSMLINAMLQAHSPTEASLQTVKPDTKFIVNNPERYQTLVSLQRSLNFEQEFVKNPSWLHHTYWAAGRIERRISTDFLEMNAQEWQLPQPQSQQSQSLSLLQQQQQQQQQKQPTLIPAWQLKNPTIYVHLRYRLSFRTPVVEQKMGLGSKLAITWGSETDQKSYYALLRVLNQERLILTANVGQMQQYPGPQLPTCPFSSFGIGSRPAANAKQLEEMKLEMPPDLLLPVPVMDAIHRGSTGILRDGDQLLSKGTVVYAASYLCVAAAKYDAKHSGNHYTNMVRRLRLVEAGPRDPHKFYNRVLQQDQVAPSIQDLFTSSARYKDERGTLHFWDPAHKNNRKPVLEWTGQMQLAWEEAKRTGDYSKMALYTTDNVIYHMRNQTEDAEYKYLSPDFKVSAADLLSDPQLLNRRKKRIEMKNSIVCMFTNVGKNQVTTKDKGTTFGGHWQILVLDSLKKLAILWDSLKSMKRGGPLNDPDQLESILNVRQVIIAGLFAVLALGDCCVCYVCAEVRYQGVGIPGALDRLPPRQLGNT